MTNPKEISRKYTLSEKFKNWALGSRTREDLMQFFIKNPEFLINQSIGGDRGFENQPLDYVVRWGSADQVCFLLEMGAQSSNKKFARPLAQLLRTVGHTTNIQDRLEKIEFLLQHGENPTSYAEHTSFNPMADLLERCAQHHTDPMVLPLGMNVIDLLIEYGWDKDKLCESARAHLDEEVEKYQSGYPLMEDMLLKIQTAPVKKRLQKNLPDSLNSNNKTPKARL